MQNRHGNDKKKIIIYSVRNLVFIYTTKHTNKLQNKNSRGVCIKDLFSYFGEYLQHVIFQHFQD